MKAARFNVLYYIMIILFSLQLEAKPLINSHLRVWNEQQVVSHFNLGVDIVEIDIFNLIDSELDSVMAKLKNFPNQTLALHLKGFNKAHIPEIESYIEKHQRLWKQLWFFSGDTEIDRYIKSKFPLGYVTRSTKQDVMACLGYGLDDDAIFLSHCISKDLWIRPSMMSNTTQKNRMKLLVLKIRDFEKIHSVSPALIALDQIDTEALYCEFVLEFGPLIDGIVTEDLEKIIPFLKGHRRCSDKHALQMNLMLSL